MSELILSNMLTFLWNVCYLVSLRERTISKYFIPLFSTLSICYSLGHTDLLRGWVDTWCAFQIPHHWRPRMSPELRVFPVAGWDSQPLRYHPSYTPALPTHTLFPELPHKVTSPFQGIKAWLCWPNTEMSLELQSSPWGQLLFTLQMGFSLPHPVPISFLPQAHRCGSQGHFLINLF